MYPAIRQSYRPHRHFTANIDTCRLQQCSPYILYLNQNKAAFRETTIIPYLKELKFIFAWIFLSYMVEFGKHICIGTRNKGIVWDYIRNCELMPFEWVGCLMFSMVNVTYVLLIKFYNRDVFEYYCVRIQKYLYSVGTKFY